MKEKKEKGRELNDISEKKKEKEKENKRYQREGQGEGERELTDISQHYQKSMNCKLLIIFKVIKSRKGRITRIWRGRRGKGKLEEK